MMFVFEFALAMSLIVLVSVMLPPASSVPPSSVIAPVPAAFALSKRTLVSTIRMPPLKAELSPPRIVSPA